MRVLAAGESWVSESTHYKGFDSFQSVVYETGIAPLKAAVEPRGIEVVHMPAHEVPERFPASVEALDAFDVVVLSDIGANSILLHPDTWLRGRRTPNRLKVLAEWVRAGGGLLMAGGYMSFQGFEGKAMYRRTPVEEVLPVTIDPWDDRVETPEGAEVTVVDAAHPVLLGIQGPWPGLLGYNRVTLKDDAILLASVGEDPLLALREEGAGRTAAWTSDIGPHWCPDEFVAWPGYARLFTQLFRWLAGE
ncbi:MAG: glutamine amidotransferase [Anaerosomatales bacterium]|nr:glutamine amidotransferase [Anaerosomatales bacterium]